jgi:hypothetical protein
MAFTIFLGIGTEDIQDCAVHYHDQIGLPKNAEASKTLWVPLPPHKKIEVLVFFPN